MMSGPRGRAVFSLAEVPGLVTWMEKGLRPFGLDDTG